MFEHGYFDPEQDVVVFKVGSLKLEQTSARLQLLQNLQEIDAKSLDAIQCLKIDMRRMAREDKRWKTRDWELQEPEFLQFFRGLKQVFVVIESKDDNSRGREEIEFQLLGSGKERRPEVEWVVEADRWAICCGIGKPNMDLVTFEGIARISPAQWDG